MWIWPGDAALANADHIPHPAWADNPEWAFGGGMFHVRCDYRLMIDNLMDLTHETYVHATSIGQKEIDEAPSETMHEGDAGHHQPLHERHPRAALLADGAAHERPADDKPVDRWQICRFTPPSQVMIEVGVALAATAATRRPRR